MRCCRAQAMMPLITAEHRIMAELTMSVDFGSARSIAPRNIECHVRLVI